MPIGDIVVPAKPIAEKVDWACGRGYHMNPWGDCRPNHWRPPPPPRYYGHRWDRRDRWDDRGPPRWEGRGYWRDRRDWR
ncbi:GCG_CRPN prefix-to-repeats domain-containing protein [Neorhizobium galegae]